MRIVWTDEAVDDLASILAYYHREVGPRTADAVERRIIDALESLPAFTEGASERVAGTRERVIGKLPYSVFYRAIADDVADEVLILNIVHSARKFPA